MATYTPPPTPTETRIVIEMTEAEALVLRATIFNDYGINHAEGPLEKLRLAICQALASPAVPARAARKPDTVETRKFKEIRKHP